MASEDCIVKTFESRMGKAARTKLAADKERELQAEVDFEKIMKDESAKNARMQAEGGGKKKKGKGKKGKGKKKVAKKR